MSDHPSESEPQDDAVVEAELVDDVAHSSIEPNRLSASGIISWIIVACITVAVISIVATSQQTVSETVGGDATSGDLLQVQLVGKMLVGQQELQNMSQQMLASQAAPDAASDDLQDDEEDEPLNVEEVEAIETAIATANTGTFEQQLACVVLLNELRGPERALENLSDLDERVVQYGFEPSENQTTLHEAVSNVVNACVDDSFDDATLSIEEEALLAERMGWIGRLAAVPVQSGRAEMREEVVSEATASAMVCTLAMMAGLLAIVAGFVLAGFAIRQFNRGGFVSRFHKQAGTHNIYIETFAIWLTYFFGVQFLLGFVSDVVTIDPLMLSPLIMFSSLIVLVWPVIRGISFSQVRQDIGWTSTRPMRDVLSAPIGYLATLPMVALSFVLMAGLIMQSMQPTDNEEFSRGQSISHPIQEYASDSTANVILWVVLAACVAAPIVEETVFRGILYRHLRDVTAHWRTVASVAFSSLLNGFIFAAIHPQGVMLIPVLGALAVGFSLMREWRGSLYPSMIMHAIHNSLVTCLMFTIL
jgi:membrane protease YdiL (CAAX protease family)